MPVDIITVIMKYYPIFKWSRQLTHSEIMIENDTIENKQTRSAWIHAYDCEEYNKGTIEWTVKILNETYKSKYNCNHWTIGVVDSSKVHMEKYFPDRNGDGGIGYNSSGGLYHGGYDKYGPKYGIGDIITTIADFDTLSISFMFNGTGLGKVEKKLSKDTKYRFAVTSYCGGDKLTYLMSRDE